jgi:integrase
MVVREQMNTGNAAAVIVPVNARADNKSRLTRFARWLDDTDCHWSAPDLAAYRDYLLTEYKGRNGKPLAPISTAAHLATIRGRYRQLLDDSLLHDRLKSMVPGDVSAEEQDRWVTERLEYISQVIDPQEVAVTIPPRKQTPQQFYLSAAQANALLCAPLHQIWSGAQPPLVTLRDTAMIALLLATGIREAELVRLNVEDLRHEIDGVIALRVRPTKGEPRLVPYGDMTFALTVAEAWLKQAGLEEGALFRGVYRGGRRLRQKRVSARAVNQMLARYPIMVGNRLRTVTPYDLRRTYARIAYRELRIPLDQIQKNLGHASPNTTKKYIGPPEVESLPQGNPYSFNLDAVLQISRHGEYRSRSKGRR